MIRPEVIQSEKVYYVKRLRLLTYLVERGFNKYKVVPDPMSTKDYNWFVFERTPEFDEAVAEYFAQL